MFDKMRMFAALVIAIVMQACSYAPFYQVCRVNTNVEKMDNALVYSDSICDIVYHLWGKNGSLGFVFVNKTENDVVIDLENSFFIKNGMAYDYYRDREYTVTESVGLSSSESLMGAYFANVAKYGYTHRPYLNTPTAASAGAMAIVGEEEAWSARKSKSVMERAAKYVVVPAGASRELAGFAITKLVFLQCDNDKYNRPKKESETMYYTKEESPMVLRNRIMYVAEGKEYVVDNSFWVESIKNYREEAIIKNRIEEDCITGEMSLESRFVISGPDMFYNVYEFLPSLKGNPYQ